METTEQKISPTLKLFEGSETMSKEAPQLALRQESLSET